MIQYPDAFPQHLRGLVTQGGVIGEPIAQFLIGDMRNLVYLIIDWTTGVAAVVDPQKDLSLIDDFLAKNGLKLVAIFLTHSHHDHVAGLPELLRRDPALPVYVHEADAFRLKARAHLLKGGEMLKVGQLEVLVIHAPGHSVGEVCYYLKPYLLTGDTLFVRECGRTDLPTGDDAQMFQTLARLKKFPGETVILPGHQYAPEVNSWLARELQTSAPLLAKTLSEFALL